MAELWKPQRPKNLGAMGDQTRYYRGRTRRSRNFLRSKLFIQTASVLFIFIFIWVTFQFNGPMFIGMQKTIRTWFTEDTDLTPVVNVIKKIGLYGDSFERAGYEVIAPEANIPVLEQMTIPVSGTVTKPYGWTMIEGKSSFHNGIEIEAPLGSAVKAAYDGTVLEIKNHEKLGRVVVISHKGGLVTTYGYCSEILIKEDQQVTQGQVIAKIGTLDGAKQGKLYFEANKLGEPVNPMDLISSSKGI
ncbi:MAG: peptidoglycan DD-metalloendopeptidase family protein [Peptococcales bacterium]|jgi:murein DD-endopeptidase MepM/ murein hydrolase activator NlpD